MKLINYKRGYNNIFDCSIHGTIYMNRSEYEKMTKFLYKNIEKLNPYKDTLYPDLSRRICVKNGFYINIRATATEMIVKKYNLANYKRGNYQLFIEN